MMQQRIITLEADLATNDTITIPDIDPFRLALAGSVLFGPDDTRYVQGTDFSLTPKRSTNTAELEWLAGTTLHDGDVIAIGIAFIDSVGTGTTSGGGGGGGGGGGDASAAKQDAQITILSSIDGHVDGLEGFTDGLETLLTSGNTLATTLNGYVDGLETLVGATNTLLTATNGYVDGVETLIGSTNTALGGLNTLITTQAGYLDGVEGKLDTLHTDIATTLIAKFPAALSTAGYIKVAPDGVDDAVAMGGSAGAANTVFDTKDTDGAGHITWAFSAVGTGCTFRVEGSHDGGTTWFASPWWNTQSSGGTGTQTDGTPSAAQAYIAPVTAKKMRVKQINWSSGTTTMAGHLRRGPMPWVDFNMRVTAASGVSSLPMQGAGGNLATSTGNPVYGGAIYESAPGTATDGQRTALHTTNKQELLVTLSSGGVNFAAIGNNHSDSTANTVQRLSVAAMDMIYNPGTTNWNLTRTVVTGTDSTGTGILAAGLLAQFDDTSPSSVTENQFGNLRMNANRVLLVDAGATANPTSTLTRPANTTPYSQNDVISSNVTAGSVVVPSFVGPRIPGGGTITRARLSSNVTTGWDAIQVEVRFWSTAPTYTNGDNGAYAIATGAAGYLGKMVVTLEQFADGAVGVGAPAVGNGIAFKLAANANIYWDVKLISASGATPISGQTFTLTPEIIQD